MGEHETWREAEFSVRRISWLTGGLVMACAAIELAILRSPAGALSLTAAGGVAIINFRWLEAVLVRVVQPGRPRFDRASGFRIVARMALFGAFFAALLWVPDIDPVAVAFGFSALVVALIAEGVRWARVGGG